LATVATLAALAWIGVARADQPSPGASSVDAPTITLQGDGQADTDLVRGYHGGGYHGGGHHGGYHGHYGGNRGYYGGYHNHGYYGGYKNYYGGYYRPYYANYYRPYFAGYSYYSSPYYANYYTPAYNNYYPSYYYPPAYSYCIGGTTQDYAAAPTPLNSQPYMPPVTSAAPGQGPPTAGLPGGTPKPYQYDGGPNSPVPMPQDTPEPQKGNGPLLPLKGYPVSITGSPQNSGYTFSAYGQPSAMTPATKTQFAFPAYGEKSKSSNFAVGGK